MIQSGDNIDLNQGYDYTAVISTGASSTIPIIGMEYSDRIITVSYSDGSTKEVDIYSLIVVKGDSGNLIYISSTDGSPKDSGVSSSNVLLKTSDVAQTISSGLNLTGDVQISTLKMLDYSTTSENINSVKYISNSIDPDSNDSSSLITKEAVLKLFGSVSSGSSGFSIKGTAGNIIILDSEGTGLDDAETSISDLLLKFSSEEQTVNSDVKLFDSDFSIKTASRSDGNPPVSGRFELTNNVYVQYIRSIPDSDTSSISLLTHDGVQYLINSANLNSLIWQKKVLGAVDIQADEPIGNTTGDRYINTNTSDGAASSTAQVITALAIVEWDSTLGASGEWVESVPSLGWSPLNEATSTYWRLVADNSAPDGKVWEDPSTNIGTDHDAASNVRDTDGNTMTASTARHLNSTEADALTGGVAVSASVYHTHDDVSSTKAGMTPVLPATTNNQFLKDTGVWADVELSNDSDISVLGNALTVRSIGSDVGGLRLNNSFRYSWQSHIDPTNVYSYLGYKIELPQEEYYLKGKVFTNYGGFIEFEVACKSFSTSIYTAQILNDYGVGTNTTSGIKLRIDNLGKNISVDASELDTKFASIHSSLSGNLALINDIVVSYDLVPASHNITVSGISTSVVQNFTQSTTALLSTNNVWQGAQEFNDEVELNAPLIMNGEDITSVGGVYAESLFLGSVSAGDKLVVGASGIIKKDIKEQTQELSITGVMSDPYIIDLADGRKIKLSVDTSTDATSDLTISNMDEGDELFIKMVFTQTSTITWNFPIADVSTLIFGSTGTSYVFTGVIGTEYWIGIQRLDDIYNVIITKAK